MATTSPAMRAVYGAGGVFLLVSGARLLYEALTGDRPGAEAPPRLSGVLPERVRARLHEVHTVEDRVRLLRGLIRKGGLDARLHMLAGKILNRRCNGEWCVRPMDQLGEIRAIGQWWQRRLRYMRDMRRADTFESWERAIEKGGTDCDGQTIAIGATLEAAGYAPLIRVVQTVGYAQPNHVYPIGCTSPPPGGGQVQCMVLDASVAKPMGWEVPGASEAARTGRPAGKTLRAWTFWV